MKNEIVRYTSWEEKIKFRIKKIFQFWDRLIYKFAFNAYQDGDLLKLC